MSLINYSLEPRSDIAFIDMKSFYASVECIARGLHPLKASLCVMSRADNCKGPRKFSGRFGRRQGSIQR